MKRASAILILACLLTSFALGADEEEKAPLFAEPKKDWAWDEDKRFDFLMERLASLEASLDAVDAALAKASGKRGVALGKSRSAERGNEAMDRKGGGPMPWNEFYGTTAEKFFYHPVDPNTTYHTTTALQQVQPTSAGGVPGNQGVPAHQRPPQFDYIYRANREAKDKAEKEALAMQGRIEELSQRKSELEKEQAALWCLLAFRAIQRLDIPEKPVLRFQLIAASADAKDVDKAKALAAAARFLATSLLIIEKAEDDQSTAFGNVKKIMTNARKDFNDALLNADAVAEDGSDKTKTLGKYAALAKLLDDTSSNLSESYVVATEGDQAKDFARKERFRGLLQRSLVEYAQIVLALDELLGVIKTDWKVSVDTKTPASSVGVTWGEARVPRSDREHNSDTPQPITPTTARLRKKFSASKVVFDEKKGVLTLTYDFARRDQLLKDFQLPDKESLVVAGKGSLRLAASEAMIHVVEFREGSISGRFTYGNRDGNQTLLGASMTSIRLDRLVGGTVDELRLQLWSEGQHLTQQDIGYSTPLRIQWDVTERKVRANVNGKELGGNRIVEKDAGRFGLYGANGGLKVDAPLVISGIPKAGWLEGFLAE